MVRKAWFLLLLLPLLVGCGAGLEEGGRIPVDKPFGLSSSQEFTMTVGSPATYRGSGTFEDVSTNLNVNNVRRYILFQRLQASARVNRTVELPTQITLSDFRISVTVSDVTGSRVSFSNLRVEGQVVLRRQRDDLYTVTVGEPGGLRAVVEQEAERLVQLARIVTSGGTNTVEVILTATVSPDLPSGTQITFTAGVGTGTLEL